MGSFIRIRRKFISTINCLNHVLNKFKEVKLGRSILLLLLANLLILLYPEFKWPFTKDTILINIRDVDTFERTSPLVSDWLVRSYFPKSILQSIFVNSSIASNDSDIFHTKVYSQINKQYDPRLLPALWINSLTQYLKDSPNDVDFSLPFSWSSFLDIQSKRNELSIGVDLSVLNCEKFSSIFNIDHTNVSRVCTSLKNSPKGYPKFKIIGPIDDTIDENARKVIGLSYMLHGAPNPDRLVLLGIGPNKSGISIPVNEMSKRNAYSKSDLSYLISKYINSIPQFNVSIPSTNSIILRDELRQLHNYWDQFEQNISFASPYNFNHDIFQFLDNNSEIPETKLDDFYFDVDETIQLVESRVKRSYDGNGINDFDRRLLSVINDNLEFMPNFTKYFHEAHCLDTKKGAHYDWRFFKKITYSEYERKAILHRLTRAWLRFANSAGLSTWLAHGSLLGWYWNGMSLPWDEDLDVQMTSESLYLLARNFNQSLVIDLTDNFDDINIGMGAYLVDVSSNFFSRDKGNGYNSIDARFIDTSTGFYVDITALSYTEAAKTFDTKGLKSLEFNRMLEPEYLEKEDSNTVDSEQLHQSLLFKRDDLIKQRNIFNCRNNHFYTLEDISPLKRTMFEGVIAYVPNGYKKILEREYNRSLLLKQFEGHTFRPVLGLWISSKICKRDPIGNQCFHDDVVLEAKYTNSMTTKHKVEMRSINKAPIIYSKEDELRAFRSDPWIISRCNSLRNIIENL
ncbi:LicD family-domain-containing protein [Scheffersomyces amazonensis]|uniref:LicD family-domain-containing protein n=1 Tax=Scheffersomyces amazonensis TaxID=1078765 RepID=UPI00315CABCF